MKILILSRSVVGSQMASQGIRYYHVARVLSEQLPDADVTLGVPSETDISDDELPFRIVTYTHRSAVSLVRSSDIVIAGTLPPHLLPFMMSKHVILDLYSPYYTEWLALSTVKRHLGARRNWMETNRQYLIMQLASADFVLCANDRQRDLYVGMLASLGLLTPEVYDEDPMLEHLFGIVPYGVRPGIPRATQRRLKGVRPGIGETDKVLIWNGTLIEWYDVDTLLDAMGRLSSDRPDIKLFFLGTAFPRADGGEDTQGLGGGVVRSAVARCEEMGTLDRTVFFNPTWCDYDETTNYLLEADAGVCTSFDTVESRYAFRTRYVDLFWAGVPLVVTQGDVLADRVESEPLGLTVPPEDPTALSEAIIRAVDDEALIAECKANLERIREEYQWERVLEPLLEYCRRRGEQPGSRGPGRRLRVAGPSTSYGRARLYQYIYSKIVGEI